MYVVNGVQANARSNFAQGVKGDCWKLLYKSLDERTARGQSTIMEWVPSHIGAGGANFFNAGSIIVNELADVEAEIHPLKAADTYSKQIAEEERQYKRQYYICLRLAAIEAHIRKFDLGVRPRSNETWEHGLKVAAAKAAETAVKGR